MDIKLKTLFFIIAIITIIAISRFTTLADVIKNQVTLFLTPPEKSEVIDGFYPYLIKEREITREMRKVRDMTDANGVGLVLFHDEDKNLTTLTSSYFTVIYEEVAPGMINTAGTINNVPISSIFDAGIKTLSECSGWEFGGGTTPDLFKNLPPRPLITCVLRYKNVIVGVIYIVDSYEKRSLTTLVKLTPQLSELAAKIDNIVSK